MQRKLVNFRLDPALIERAKERARAEGLTLTGLVDEAIKAKLGSPLVALGSSGGSDIAAEKHQAIGAAIAADKLGSPPPVPKRDKPKPPKSPPERKRVVQDLQARIDEMVKGPGYRGLPNATARRIAQRELERT